MAKVSFQKRGSNFIINTHRAFIISPTGSGKTRIALNALAKIPGNIVVFCPKSTEEQWKKSVSEKKLSARLLIITLSIASVTRYLVHKHLFWAPVAVLVDEPQPLKSSTQLFQLFRQIKPDRRIILDATPIENSLSDLWFIFKWLRPNVLKDFVYEDFVTERNAYKNLCAFRQMIKENIFVVDRSEVSLRERVTKYLAVDFKLKKAERSEMNTLLLELDEQLKKKNIKPAFGLISKLRSFMSNVNSGARGKVRALSDYLNRHPSCRGVIFTHTKDAAKALVEVLNKKGISTLPVIRGDVSAKQREKIRNAFNFDSSYRFIVATRAGERGIDLPAGDIIVHFDLPWTEAAFNQRDRVTRLSSSRNTATTILVLITRDSIEEVLAGFIRFKAKVAMVPFSKEDEIEIKKPNWSFFVTRYLQKRGLLGVLDESHSKKAG